MLVLWIRGIRTIIHWTWEPKKIEETGQIKCDSLTVRVPEAAEKSFHDVRNLLEGRLVTL